MQLTWINKCFSCECRSSLQVQNVQIEHWTEVFWTLETETCFIHFWLFVVWVCFFFERAILKILYNVGCAKVKLFETSYKYSKMQRFESVCLQNEVETEYAALYWKTPFEKRKIVFDREYFVAIFIYFYIYLILWLFISLKWQQCFGYAVYKNKLKYLNKYIFYYC